MRSWARTSRYNGRILDRVSARIELGDESIIGTKQLGVEDLTELATTPT